MLVTKHLLTIYDLVLSAFFLRINKSFFKQLVGLLISILAAQISYAQEPLTSQEIAYILKDRSITKIDSALNSVIDRLMLEKRDPEALIVLMDSVNLLLADEDPLTKVYNHLITGKIFKKSNSVKAISAIDIGLTLAIELNDTSLILDLGMVKGNIYKFNYLYERAISTYFDNLEFLSGSTKNFKIAQLYAAIAMLQYEGNLSSSEANFTETRNNLKQSIKYYKKIEPKTANTNFQIMNHTNTVALTFTNSNPDSALYYFKQALDVNKIVKNEFWEVLINANSAYVYIERNQLDSALTFLNADIEQSLLSEQWNSAAVAIITASECYIKKGMLDLALTKILAADSLIRLYNMGAMDKRVLFRAYTHYYEATANWNKAYQYQSKLIVLQDSLNILHNKEELNKTQSRYKFEHQTKENKLVEERNKLLVDEIKTKNALFAITIIIGVLIIIFAVLLYRQYRIKHKLNTQLNKTNKKIKNHKNVLESEVVLRTKALKKINAELDNYLYHSSHDVRAPISTILGLVEVGRLEKSEKGFKHILELVAYSATKMDSMLKKMQNLYFLNNSKDIDQTINLVSLINEIVDTNRHLITTSGALISIDLEENIEISTNKILLTMCLTNIIENALIFGQDKSYAENRVDISSKYIDNKLAISIKDTGEGISSDFIDRVFDLYFRGSSKSTGNGLGLFIAKKAITEIGGDVQVETEQYKGTTFTVII